MKNFIALVLFIVCVSGCTHPFKISEEPRNQKVYISTINDTVSNLVILKNDVWRLYTDYTYHDYLFKEKESDISKRIKLLQSMFKNDMTSKKQIGKIKGTFESHIRDRKLYGTWDDVIFRRNIRMIEEELEPLTFSLVQ